LFKNKKLLLVCFFGILAAALQSHIGCSSFRFSPNGISPCSGEGFSLSICKVMGHQQVGHHPTLAVVLPEIFSEKS
jgi:hypothetical protein